MIKIRLSNSEFRCRIGLSEWEALHHIGKAESEIILPDSTLLKILLVSKVAAMLSFQRNEFGYLIEIPAEKLILLNAPNYDEISSEIVTPHGAVRFIVEMDYSQVREKSIQSEIHKTQ